MSVAMKVTIKNMMADRWSMRYPSASSVPRLAREIELDPASSSVPSAIHAAVGRLSVSLAQARRAAAVAAPCAHDRWRGSCLK